MKIKWRIKVFLLGGILLSLLSCNEINSSQSPMPPTATSQALIIEASPPAKEAIATPSIESTTDKSSFFTATPEIIDNSTIMTPTPSLTPPPVVDDDSNTQTTVTSLSPNIISETNLQLPDICIDAEAIHLDRIGTAANTTTPWVEDLYTQELRYFCTFGDQIVDLSISPQGELLVAKIKVGVDLQAIETANLLINIEDGSYKLLGNGYQELINNFVWLQNGDGEILWADTNGEIFLGTTYYQTALVAPAHIKGLWSLSENLILALDKDYNFWQLDLSLNDWSQIAMAHDSLLPSPTSSFAYMTGVSANEGNALVFQWDSIYQILRDMNQVVHTIPNNPYRVIGTDSPNFPTPKQVSGYPYWFIDIPIWREFSDRVYPANGLLINETNGEEVSAEILQIPSDSIIASLDISPENTQIAIEVGSEFNEANDGKPVLISETLIWSALQNSLITAIDGEFAGWGPNDNIVVKNISTDSFNLINYLSAPITSKELYVSNNGKFMTSLSGSVILAESNAGLSRFVNIDIVNNNEVSSIEFSEFNGFKNVEYITSTSERIYFTAEINNQSIIVEWTPET